MSVHLSGSHGTWSLPEGATTIGRGKNCGLCFADPRLSRKHVTMHVTGSHLVIEDLGSTNGALVNSDRISGRVDLKHGDIVVIGPCIFTVKIDNAPNAPNVENIDSNPMPPHDHGRSETQTMDPVDLRDKQIDPGIAAIVQSGMNNGDKLVKNDTFLPMDFPARAKSPLKGHGAGTPATEKVPTESLKPNDFKVQTTSALHAGPKAVVGQPRSSAQTVTVESEALSPNDAKKNVNQDALQIHTDAPLRYPGGMRQRRTIAGALDGLQTCLIGTILSLPIAVCSYGVALRQAHVILQDNLPRLPYGTSEPATFTQIVMSLASLSGWQRAMELSELLHAHEDQKPFMLLFFGATLSILIFVLTHLLATVAATVLKGAPLWHRSQGLVLVNRSTGHYLGWGRAMLRWSLFFLLWPVGIISMALNKPSVYDMIAGSEVKPRR